MIDNDNKDIFFVDEEYSNELDVKTETKDTKSKTTNRFHGNKRYSKILDVITELKDYDSKISTKHEEFSNIFKRKFSMLYNGNRSS